MTDTGVQLGQIGAWFNRARGKQPRCPGTDGVGVEGALELRLCGRHLAQGLVE